MMQRRSRCARARVRHFPSNFTRHSQLNRNEKVSRSLSAHELMVHCARPSTTINPMEMSLQGVRLHKPPARTVAGSKHGMPPQLKWHSPFGVINVIQCAKCVFLRIYRCTFFSSIQFSRLCTDWSCIATHSLAIGINFSDNE